MVYLYFEQRTVWVEYMSRYLDDKNRKDIQPKVDKKDQLFEDYLEKVEKLGDKEGDIKGKLTQFFNLTNGFRNAANKEVNQMESIIHENIRHGPLARNPDLKKSVNVDYVNAKKAFVEQDQKLRKRMSEILNAPKK